MTEITPEQRAAWQRINMDVQPGTPYAADLALITPLLPDDITAPPLPTEPGIYASSDDMAWALIEDVGWTRAEAEGVMSIDAARAAAPFRRLVVEPETITIEHISAAARAANRVSPRSEWAESGWLTEFAEVLLATRVAPITSTSSAETPHS